MGTKRIFPLAIAATLFGRDQERRGSHADAVAGSTPAANTRNAGASRYLRTIGPGNEMGFQEFFPPLEYRSLSGPVVMVIRRS
jgi:hypothetical protein